MENINASKGFRPGLIFSSITTFISVFLAFLALTDITNGIQSSYIAEYNFLIAIGLWFLIISALLIRFKFYIIGTISLAAIIAAIAAQPFIGPGTVPGFRYDYLVTVFVLLWFIILSVILFITGLKNHRNI